jgi:hypothetical protein
VDDVLAFDAYAAQTPINKLDATDDTGAAVAATQIVNCGIEVLQGRNALIIEKNELLRCAC